MTKHESDREGMEAVKYVAIFVTVALVLMLVLIGITSFLTS